MMPWTAWWRELSDPDRFRLYTKLTFQVVLAGLAIYFAAMLDAPWQTVGTLLAGAAAALVLETRPELSGWIGDRLRRRFALLAITVMAAVAVANIVAARTTTGDAAYEHGLTALFVVLVASWSVIPFLRHRWWVLAAVAVVVSASLADSVLVALTIGALLLGIGVLFAATTILSVWALRVVERLERARSTEAELQVAEERLRFARDLHDVVGRGFSAVAVKSELASALARSGRAERAAEEMDEVKALAVESMEQMRSLVRGYRDVSLATEVDGARSLLSSAGCRLTVEGAAANVPTRYHEVAAWVVREGTTNIVKHSAASTATLMLGTDGMSLRNDAATKAPGARSGQRGLEERLAAVGATMSTSSDGEVYVLEVRWEAP